MLQSEFDRLTSRPYTEAEFSEIHYVYCYHPAVQSKKDIADLWTIGGICIIKDMLPTARRVKEENADWKPPERNTNVPGIGIKS